MIIELTQLGLLQTTTTTRPARELREPRELRTGQPRIGSGIQRRYLFNHSSSNVAIPQTHGSLSFSQHTNYGEDVENRVRNVNHEKTL